MPSSPRTDHRARIWDAVHTISHFRPFGNRKSHRAVEAGGFSYYTIPCQAVARCILLLGESHRSLAPVWLTNRDWIEVVYTYPTLVIANTHLVENSAA